MKVITVETPELGDRSYIVGEGGPGSEAVVIDPQRDLDRVEQVLEAEGWTCVLVLETHLHNDYVTGGLELAKRTGAAYAVQGRDDVAFERCAVHDGDILTAGTLEVHVLETPGHTENHVSYVIGHHGAPTAVFSGGSLLYGAVGRTDLVDDERTQHLTRAQYHSARRLGELNADAELYPTHGFGSMCSSGGSTGATASTIGHERTVNVALTQDDEEKFVADLLAGLTAYPAYYAHMGARNAEGPGAADLTPAQPVDADEIAKRIAAGEWVVDLRDRTAYAIEHLAGSVGIALGQQFATYLGWVIPWGTPLTLIGETPEQVADAQRQLVRIGIDRPAGAASGNLAELAGGTQVRGYPRRTFADLAAEPAAVVLDVRRDDERAGGGIAGSTHVPLHSLLSRLDEVPEGPLWVHCAAGFRASIAASLLDRAGHDVVFIDDEWEHAAEAGLQIV
ncbi:MAG: MBL fold metallo-hydrolase [Mycobacteriales bacterium]